MYPTSLADLGYLRTALDTGSGIGLDAGLTLIDEGEDIVSRVLASTSQGGQIGLDSFTDEVGVDSRLLERSASIADRCRCARP